jgi:hypothetical protein
MIMLTLDLPGVDYHYTTCPPKQATKPLHDRLLILLMGNVMNVTTGSTSRSPCFKKPWDLYWQKSQCFTSTESTTGCEWRICVCHPLHIACECTVAGDDWTPSCGRFTHKQGVIGCCGAKNELENVDGGCEVNV